MAGKRRVRLVTEKVTLSNQVDIVSTPLFSQFRSPFPRYRWLITLPHHENSGAGRRAGTTNGAPLSYALLRTVNVLADNPLRQMMAEGLKVSIRSDGRADFGGYLNANLNAAVEQCNLTDAAQAMLAWNSFEATFLNAQAKAGLIAVVDSGCATAPPPPTNRSLLWKQLPGGSVGCCTPAYRIIRTSPGSTRSVGRTPNATSISPSRARRATAVADPAPAPHPAWRAGACFAVRL
ncbi:hypothetical protein [Glutamicibacter sp. MNS18]|uniref:hypothetical protein n=1 Tax=Glutamicibacter sp. MNS18 TaxID=2989817 RepID=UPI003531D258